MVGHIMREELRRTWRGYQSVVRIERHASCSGSLLRVAIRRHRRLRIFAGELLSVDMTVHRRCWRDRPNNQ